MKQQKITFYPKPEAANALKAAPSKKTSERVNSLILKGLSKEKEEEIKNQYERFDREIANAPKRVSDARGVSNNLLLAQRLFTEDDDSSDEGLF